MIDGPVGLSLVVSRGPEKALITVPELRGLSFAEALLAIEHSNVPVAFTMYFCGIGEALSAMLPSGRRESDVASLEVEELEIGEKPLVLSGEQRLALERITRSGSGTFYLYGYTGTGKTEVFLQAAEATLAEGRGVIYLVPEIALTGQVVEAASRRFGARCAVIHSHLTPSQKLSEWRRILKGEADVVIGARSAVFAPLAKLGLIVIDEEHERDLRRPHEVPLQLPGSLLRE